MSSTKPLLELRQLYEDAAQEYLESLPPEHFMEAVPHSKQREITLASLALVTYRRPEIQVFNELLVQYPIGDREYPGQVVPDNMIVISAEPIEAYGSYDLVIVQSAAPFCMLEYVSKSNKRKDYVDNMVKYETELKVPYYLLFDSDKQDLRLYKHNKRKYVKVKPNVAGRLSIPELDLEAGLMEEWVRFWFQGELLPLPADLQQDLDEARRQLIETESKLNASNAKLTNAVTKLNDTETRLNDTETRLVDSNRQRDEERRLRLAIEQELIRLRAQISQGQGDIPPS